MRITFAVAAALIVFALVLAAASQLTTTIRLGLGAVILPYHHPVQVAERVAMLDILSGGRVEFAPIRADFHSLLPTPDRKRPSLRGA